MNNKRLSLMLKNFGTAICLCLLFSLISCENFLKANDVASEIKAQIDYANAPSSTVLLKSDESMGTFIAGDSKEFKIGYDTEIYFSANIENGLLDYLVATSATDASKDMSEYIKIDIVERDDEKGFYKIIVRVLKQAPDIIIKPVCIPFPAVVSYTPKSDSEPSYANTGITVTFNTPMEAESILAAQSIFNYKNIFIKYNGSDISQYFETPKFNNEKTVLTLTPKKTFVDFIKSTNEISIKVNVIFSNSISIKKEDRNLSLKQDNNSNFFVSYKPQAESTPPSTNGFGFFASNDEYTLENLSNKTKTDILEFNIFNQDQIAKKGNISQTEYEEKVLQNRIYGPVYIYGRYIDQDSGINKITVSSLHANDKTGFVLNKKAITKDYYVNEEYPEVTFYKQDENVLFRIKWELPENTENPEDVEGAYNFNVQVFDACDNASEVQTFTVIKTIQFDISGLKVFNVYMNLETNESDNAGKYKTVREYYNNGKYNDLIKTIKFLYENPVYSVVKSADDIDFTIKYIDKDEGEVEKPVYASQNNKKYFEYKLNVDHVYDQSFTLTAKNKYGTIESKTFYFPPRPQKSPYGNYVIIPKDAKITCFWKDYLETDGKMITTSNAYPTIVKPTCNSFCYMTGNDGKKGIVYYENNLLFSECCENPITEINRSSIELFTKINKTSPTSFKSITYETNGDKYARKFTLNDNAWNNNDWDYILVALYQLNQYYPKILLPRGELTGIETVSDSISSSSNFEYVLAGIKDGKRSKYSSSTTLNPPSTDLENERLSNMAPSLAAGVYHGAKFGPFRTDNMSKLPLNKINEYLYLNNATGIIDNYQITVNNLYRYTYNSDIVSTKMGSLVYSYGTDGLYFLPMFDWSYGTNMIEVTVSNENGSYTKNVELKLEKSPIVFSAPDFSNRPVTKINLESKATAYDIANDNGNCNYVSYLDKNGWHNFGQTTTESSTIYPKIGDMKKSGSSGSYIYTIIQDDSYNGTLPANTFIKVSTSLARGNKQTDLLFFNGKPSSGDKTDKLLDMGDSFIVSSDQPVYMNTLATRKSYSECCNWTAEEWEAFRFKANEQFIPFNNTEPGLIRLYTPDTDWMQTGDCYVVIAHYADGHTKMSEVKIK